MKTVNIHEAKTNLSKLIASGEPFVIARAGKPVVQVSAVKKDAGPARLGFMAGMMRVPDDFDHMETDTVSALFEGRE